MCANTAIPQHSHVPPFGIAALKPLEVYFTAIAFYMCTMCANTAIPQHSHVPPFGIAALKPLEVNFTAIA